MGRVMGRMGADGEGCGRVMGRGVGRAIGDASGEELRRHERSARDAAVRGRVEG